MRKRRQYIRRQAEVPAPPPESRDEPAEMPVRLGLRPVVTSKGASDGSNRIVMPGTTVMLPRHEALNLINLGYASHV